MNLRCLYIVVLIQVLLCGACTPIDSLSDVNSLKRFTILSHAPLSIHIDTVRQSNDTLYIPITYGKYDFPLSIRARIETEEGVARVMGLDADQDLVFESIESSKRIMLMAPSGKTRAYVICPLEIPLNEEVEIDPRFSILSSAEGALLSDRAMLLREDTLVISAIEPTFPLDVTTRWTIAASSHFGHLSGGPNADTTAVLNNTTALRFTSLSDAYKLTVIAESGKKKVWNIRLQSLSLRSEQGTLGDAEWNNLAIDPRKLTASLNQPGFAIEESLVDPASGRVSITLIDAAQARMLIKSRAKAAAVSFPLELGFSFGTPSWISCIGLSQDQVYRFENYQDSMVCYLTDPRAKLARKWTLGIKEYFSSRAEVESLAYDYSAANVKVSRSGSFDSYTYVWDTCIYLDKSQVIAYPEEAKIFLKATKIVQEFEGDILANKQWNLSLSNLRWGLSQGASIVGTPTFVWSSNYAKAIPFVSSEIPNTCYTEGRTFDVRAEDGSIKTWTMYIQDPSYQASNLCDLTNFSIQKLVPNFALPDPSNPVITYPERGLIEIRLADDEGVYPLKVYPNMIVSSYAKVDREYLSFASAADTASFRIIAQNGTDFSEWKVCLIPPVKAKGADVASFEVGTLSPSDFRLLSAPMIGAEGVIKIPIESEDADFPLSIPYTAQISDKSAADFPLSGTLQFDNASETKKWTITSQNGERKEWFVKLDYRPQLKNGSLNSWKDSKTPLPLKYWATANNSTISGTNSTAGQSGHSADLASLMETKSALGNKAAGSTFLGWFDKENALLYGLTDPVRLTYQGIPFAATAKIKGFEVDVWYVPGKAGADWASASIELIRWNPLLGTYVYHGMKPSNPKNDYTSAPHSLNTGVRVAQNVLYLGTVAGTASDGHAVTLIPNGQWTRIFVPLEVPDGASYTHLSIMFASSALGDYFKGEVGSTYKIDNLKIIYE